MDSWNLWLIGPAVSATLAAGGLVVLLLKAGRPRFLVTWLTVLSLVVGATHLAGALTVLDSGRALLWLNAALIGELLQAGAVLALAASIFTHTTREHPSNTRWRVRAVLAAAAVLGVSVCLFSGFSIVDPGRPVTLTSMGRVAYVFLLIVMTWSLTQLEHVFRSLPDPDRYQLKFVLIGVGGLAGYEIYEASRLLLLPVWRPEYVLVGSVISVICLGLVAFGFGRSRLRDFAATVYVSHQAVYQSISFFVIGLYLVLAGVLGEWVRRTEQSVSLGLGTLVVFVAAVLLVVVLSSRSVRARFRRVVSKHLHHAKFDYRAKWLEVTSAFQSAGSLEEILDQFLIVLSRTFGAARISVWMLVEADGRFHQVRSVNTVAGPPPLPVDHPLVGELRGTGEPVEVAVVSSGRPSAAPDVWRQFLDVTHAVLCAPIQFQEQLRGFVTLSPELRGEGYGRDDRDLLRAVSRHVAVLLSHATLAEERRGAVELEALHRFSAFCLHDLKNLTARLALVVRNAETHGEDPAFRRSAMRTVASTVDKMSALMAKLKEQRFERRCAEPVDVHGVVTDVLRSTDLTAPVTVDARSAGAVSARMDRDQLHQVVLNVLLNADQAVQQRRAEAPAETGWIKVTTQQVNGLVTLTVEDSGVGINPEDMRKMFQPFRSSKPGGLGVGLYQCKRIVEAYDGTIRVTSVPGRGTRIEIELPAAQRKIRRGASMIVAQ